MWIQLSEDQEAALWRIVTLDEADVPPDDFRVIAERLAFYATPEANDQRYRDGVQTDDELECDDDAVTSPGDDDGAFVQTWTWVTNQQAGIEDDDETND
jgi:hypothetical protein